MQFHSSYFNRDLVKENLLDLNYTKFLDSNQFKQYYCLQLHYLDFYTYSCSLLFKHLINYSCLFIYFSVILIL